MTGYGWVGPKGTTIHIRDGSSKPPRWVLLLIDRVAAREREGHPMRAFGKLGRVGLRYIKGNGAGGGYCYPDFIRVREDHYLVGAKARRDSMRYLILHEMAHYIAPYGERHGQRFYEVLYRLAKAEGCLRAVTLWQGNKAAMRRARQAVEAREAAA